MDPSRLLHLLIQLLACLGCSLRLSFASETDETADEVEVESLIRTAELVVDSEKAQQQDDKNEDISHMLPHVLTSRNFGSSISDKNVWLIEIYAPWCGHCVSFASTYNEIAAHYHSDKNKDLGIRVGKIDGEAEKALSTRFHVHSYPTFFVIDGWSVYKFGQSRSKSTLMKYVEGGYKTGGVLLPFYSSPLGPLGLSQGMLISAGFSLSDVFQWLQTSFGLSPIFAGMALFGGAFVGCFVLIVFLAIILTSSPREKQD